MPNVAHHKQPQTNTRDSAVFLLSTGLSSDVSGMLPRCGVLYLLVAIHTSTAEGVFTLIHRVTFFFVRAGLWTTTDGISPFGTLVDISRCSRTRTSLQPGFVSTACCVELRVLGPGQFLLERALTQCCRVVRVCSVFCSLLQ